ncbi:hypothetical protein NM688_g5236 [Phlebia brevispora]|uniref:Uncharacterized protein n=1 Tax=Phlebia brevispora TaxID=194682 RepID=A0ACC1SZ15_9APHY|nr:hypothetical protein NM688_g5236 [Phlebia brevispora]
MIHRQHPSIETTDDITPILSKLVDYFRGKRNAQPPLRLCNTLLIYAIHLSQPRSAKDEDQTSTSKYLLSRLIVSRQHIATLQHPTLRRLTLSSHLTNKNGTPSPADMVEHYSPRFYDYHREQPEVEQETARYSQRKTRFDIHRSMYSDELIMFLHKLTEHGTTNVQMFWRTRRLDDLEEAVSAGSEAEEVQDTANETPRAASSDNRDEAAVSEDTTSGGVQTAEEEMAGAVDSQVAECEPRAEIEPVVAEESISTEGETEIGSGEYDVQNSSTADSDLA